MTRQSPMRDRRVPTGLIDELVPSTIRCLANHAHPGRILQLLDAVDIDQCVAIDLQHLDLLRHEPEKYSFTSAALTDPVLKPNGSPGGGTRCGWSYTALS